MKRLIFTLFLTSLTVMSQAQTFSKRFLDPNMYEVGYMTFPYSDDDCIYQYANGSSDNDYVNKKVGSKYYLNRGAATKEKLPVYSIVSCLNYWTLQGWQLLEISLRQSHDHPFQSYYQTIDFGFAFRRKLSPEQAQAFLKESSLSSSDPAASFTGSVDKDNIYQYAFVEDAFVKDDGSYVTLDVGETIREGYHGPALKDDEGKPLSWKSNKIEYLTLRGWQYLGRFSWPDNSNCLLFRRKVSPEEAPALMKKLIRPEE